MMEKTQVYRCALCGNIIEVVNVGGGTLTCCGKPMTPLEENTTEAAKEKHVPVIESIPGGYRVSVGSVEHPMLEKHYIQWIELFSGDQVQRRELKPGDKPQAEFLSDAASVTAREYCNLHGLWKAEKKG